MNVNEEKQIIESNFSPSLLKMAKATSFLGGIFDPKKTGFMERFIMKTLAKHSEYIDNIDNEKIRKFVDVLI